MNPKVNLYYHIKFIHIQQNRKAIPTNWNGFKKLMFYPKSLKQYFDPYFLKKIRLHSKIHPPYGRIPGLR